MSAFQNVVGAWPRGSDILEIIPAYCLYSLLSESESATLHVP